KLLLFVSLVSIAISMFGLFSQVSLSCEKRRREIAVRKINGATVGKILDMYAREYALLLAVGAAVAFPPGYLLMRRWLEQYVLQTDIPAWIYLAILLLLTCVVAACVGWRVYRASIENPADVIKNE
ncbi:MAG: FtsX-like permease family protein, partial [Tannerella sp.]|nr:FtsX-like permease family protein [Tannerella sp.]